MKAIAGSILVLAATILVGVGLVVEAMKPNMELQGGPGSFAIVAGIVMFIIAAVATGNSWSSKDPPG